MTTWKVGDERCDRCDNGITPDWCYCPFCGYPQADYMTEKLKASSTMLAALEECSQTLWDLSPDARTERLDSAYIATRNAIAAAKAAGIESPIQEDTARFHEFAKNVRNSLK